MLLVGLLMLAGSYVTKYAQLDIVCMLFYCNQTVFSHVSACSHICAGQCSSKLFKNSFINYCLFEYVWHLVIVNCHAACVFIVCFSKLDWI